MTEFASRASEKLRKQGSQTGQVLVFIRASPFVSKTKSIPAPQWWRCPAPPTISRAISQAAHTGLAGNYQPGYRYAKAGVMLLARNDASVDQGELALEETAALLRETGGPRLMHQRWKP